jgi:hypothetical protein
MYRNMLIRVDDLVSGLPQHHKLVHIETEEGESPNVQLDKYVDREDKEGNISMEGLEGSEDPRGEVNRMVRERKSSELLLQKALATGARLVPNRSPPKKK